MMLVAWTPDTTNNVRGFQSKGRSLVNIVSERIDAAAAKIYSFGSTLDTVNLDELPIKTTFFAFSGRVGVACGLRVSVIMADLVNGMDLADELEWESFLLALSYGTPVAASLWGLPYSTFMVSGEHHVSQPVL